MTPKEYSSGSTRYLGRISKRGDRYLRMLLTHGARSVLRAAKVADGSGREVAGVRRWALDVQGRSNHNKAACALANRVHPTLIHADNSSGSFAAACNDWHIGDADSFGATGHS